MWSQRKSETDSEEPSNSEGEPIDCELTPWQEGPCIIDGACGRGTREMYRTIKVSLLSLVVSKLLVITSKLGLWISGAVTPILWRVDFYLGIENGGIALNIFEQVHVYLEISYAVSWHCVIPLNLYSYMICLRTFLTFRAATLLPATWPWRRYRDRSAACNKFIMQFFRLKGPGDI